MKEAPSKVLKEIAYHIAGIHKNDLTTAEKKIGTILVVNGFLVEDKNGELNTPPKATLYLTR